MLCVCGLNNSVSRFQFALQWTLGFRFRFGFLWILHFGYQFGFLLDFSKSAKMSVVADSPPHSSSSDDFAAFLETELGDEDDSVMDPEVERVKRRKLEEFVEVSLQTIECEHPGIFGSMCFKCGKSIDEDNSGVKLGYIHKGLRLRDAEVTRLRNKDRETLIRHKKLYLVLDLDHTLLNSTTTRDLSVEEEYVRSETRNLQGSLFQLPNMPMLTKLRPFVRTFLKEASKMYDMYIYTMGDNVYAAEMANLLDPKREYFVSKVISRDESTQKHQKGLDLLLGQENAVTILDDTEQVWLDHKDNLILIERYNFFASSLRQFGYSGKSLCELRSDESEDDGALKTALDVLRQIHITFFDGTNDDLACRDVRQVLNTVRMKILEGCKIIFTRVFPEDFQADNHPFWKMAEQLGATCSTQVDSSVTHVVSRDPETEKSRWAVKEKKFLVSLQWIEAAKYRWKRQPEENFPVIKTKR